MSYFNILIYLISKTFLVTNEMIESDQKLLSTHDIATCQFFIIDAVGTRNRPGLTWEQGRTPDLHAHGDCEKVFLRNRPFPSYPLPLFQNESTCETIQMKMSLICMKMGM